MTKAPSTSTAKLHTPQELLKNAEKLLYSGDPNYMRSAVLESMATLEAYIQQTVFELLDKKMDPLFVSWLKDKTKMDMDSRINPITKLATGVDINKSSNLWREYKEAKDIRNKVAHHGRAVTNEEATKVYETVKKWLAYIGANIAVDLSLLELKQYIEKMFDNHGIVRPNERLVSNTVVNFYSSSSTFTKDITNTLFFDNFRPDLSLKFDYYKVLFEIKHKITNFDASLLQAQTLYNKIDTAEDTRIVLIMLTESKMPDISKGIIKVNPLTSVIYINI